MSDMERIVRPFQSPNFINDKKVIVKLPKVSKTGGSVLEWGSPGAPPVITSLGFDTRKAKDYREKEKETEPVRVENPDDPNQYIIEKRIKKISWEVSDTLPASGSVEQKAYSTSDSQDALLSSYNSLITQGIAPEIAQSMIYGSTSNNTPIPEAGPDTATFYPKREAGPDS